VQINNRDVLFIKKKTDDESYVHYTKPEKQKTSIDYIVEAVDFFKKEYNKVKILGLTYEYCIGEEYAMGNDVEYSSDYQGSLEAINHLVEAGVIRKYEMGAIYNDSGTWVTVKCKIDENKLMQKEAPQATVEAETLAQKIVHEHTHKFENSIQEKDVNLNHKIIQESVKPKPTAQNKQTIIYWNESGDLYRDPKIRYCYPMGQEKDRHKIVKYLINNKGFRTTFQIASIFENKSEEIIISEVGKINSMAQGKLSIRDNIILGKKGSGYRINPAYHFTLKNQ
jgi:hypothetical protein